MPLRVATKAPAKPGAEILLGDAGLPRPLQQELRRQLAFRPVAVAATLGKGPAPIVVALEVEKNDPKDLWEATPRFVAEEIGTAARELIHERIVSANLALPPLPDDAEEADALATAVVTGADRALYAFDRYKSSKAPAEPKLALVAASAKDAARYRKALPVAEGIRLARDLVNTPAEDMGPAELEKEARKIAKAGGLKIKVLDAARCARMGMGALTAVGRASHRPPRLIVLEHRGAPRSKEVLSLAGKGICFDTGGLNLKPAGGMLLMKKDMGGAATLLGVAHAIAKLAPKKNVRIYLACADNAVAGNAMRPGDVFTAMDGTTIEIGHTDAEGRLVLADAVALAKKEGATRIVDVATLTGAALIALGRVRVPLVGSDDDLCTEIENAAYVSGERVWRFPDDYEYEQAIRGKVADLRNVGNDREAGVQSGGLFIGHFAKDVPWAHLDISPASWSPSESAAGPAGGTGTMVSTLTCLATSS